jgi:hypothetical protein
MKVMLCIVALLALILTSCRREVQEKPSDKVVREKQAKPENPPKLMRLKPEYEKAIRDWEAYSNLEMEMQRFQISTPKEYVLIVENLLRLEKELSASKFPDKFNIPQLKSRILVFKTYLLQTKSLVKEERVDTKVIADQKIKLITAFNAIKKQLAEALTENITEELLKDLEK